MSLDLNYWKYQSGADLPVEEVYHAACCDGKELAVLEPLPIDAIVAEIEHTFAKWNRLDAATWEKETGGGFQLFTTPQAVRVDCNGLPREEVARFSEIMKQYGCPVYDPQQGCRFDGLALWLYGEAADIRGAVEEQAKRIFSGLPVKEVHCEPVPTGAVPIRQPEHPVLEVFVHRGKTLVKLTVNLYFGRAWTSRPTQCKAALLTGPEETGKRLTKLCETAMKRTAEDLRQRSYHR